ncbi:MAG: fermentation-respiration switch protein FrsA (DUF1100 family), partial [Gammaproteobacteria bacterium]
MFKLKSMLSSILIILIAIWLSLVILIYLFQHRLVYFPNRQLSLSPIDIGMEFEEIFLTTRDNLSLHAWYIPKSGAEKTLLFFHGNAGNISHRLESLQIFHDLGLSILILDYRGYGLSEGHPHEMGTYLDAEAAWNYLINEQRLRAQDIIIFGRSLGGGIASWLANEKAPAALILESTFTSIADMGSLRYPFLPVKFLSRIHYPTIDRVGQIQSPILFIHSPEDELIPYQHGQALYARAAAPKSFLT